MIAAAGVLEEDGEEELAPIVLRKKRRFGVLQSLSQIWHATEENLFQVSLLVLLVSLACNNIAAADSRDR